MGVVFKIGKSYKCCYEQDISRRLVMVCLEGSQKVSERFDSAVQESVHECLLVLGEIVRQAIYHHVEMKHQLKREEIPKRLEAFHKALTGIFGVGANIIEKLIAKRLYSKLGLSFVEHENWTLAEYVDDAKKHFGGR